MRLCKSKAQAAKLESQLKNEPGKHGSSLQSAPHDTSSWPQHDESEVSGLSSGNWFQISGNEKHEVDKGKDLQSVG